MVLSCIFRERIVGCLTEDAEQLHGFNLWS